MNKLSLEGIDLFRSQIDASQLGNILNVKFRGTHDWLTTIAKNREVQIVSNPPLDSEGIKLGRRMGGAAIVRKGELPFPVAGRKPRRIRSPHRFVWVYPCAGFEPFVGIRLVTSLCTDLC